MITIMSIMVCSWISYWIGYRAGIEKTRQVLYKQLWKIYTQMSKESRAEFETIIRRVCK